MTHTEFHRVDAWVFDLDNTLYPPAARLFDQIEKLMTTYVMREIGLSAEEADHMRDTWWRNHGTTLAGLMEDHGIDPLPYLAEVHDIDLSGIAPNPGLAAALSALPGTRIVYTNGSRRHAERVTAALGLEGLFHGLYGIEDAEFRPKPERVAFERVFAAAGIDPARGAMFEDDPRNLEAPKALGMCTVLVGAPHDAGFIDFHTDDLAGFLAALPSAAEA
ncbi:pyrimidine 5'-nucleotidase [Paroceanicella profunda]|uniref:Pyrimidine 5'-nucleotidase n=1 Tax=Paroceanicella profunda TaxID=2579971 RepID=A0A5B8G2W1_9RHOB|nr:pyrimidine 5'-nucleotidase [Paroceanicella profunda]QDL92983.1 pyrimidine 5'-nucleotidase [Paroceanicella profunda]